VLASITAGIAKSTMNDVTTCAQTEDRDAVERHPGRAHLEHGGDERHGCRQRGDLGNADQLRPDVGALLGS